MGSGGRGFESRRPDQQDSEYLPTICLHVLPRPDTLIFAPACLPPAYFLGERNTEVEFGLAPAPIEAEDELIQVALQVFRADAMEDGAGRHRPLITAAAALLEPLRR